VDETTKEAAAVDPAEPEKILEAANSQGLNLKLVLTTHHHWYDVLYYNVFVFFRHVPYDVLFYRLLLCDRDHAGGNEKIKQLVPGIKVYGGSIDNVKGCTDKVQNGDKVSLGADVTILALHTPWYAIANSSFQVFPLVHYTVEYGLEQYLLGHVWMNLLSEKRIER